MRTPDLAIDLGTSNTLVFREGLGVVVNEPCVVAVRDGTVVAFGRKAWELAADDPQGTLVLRPHRSGRIDDFDLTMHLLRLLLQGLGATRFSRPRILLGVPVGSTEVERRALVDAAKRAGARGVALIEEPLAAAIGAGLPIDEPVGSFIVDVGGGVTQAAMIASGGIVTKLGRGVGGFDLDEAIQAYVKGQYDIAIGDRVAEEVKIALGSALPVRDDAESEVRGRTLASGAPTTIPMGTEEVRKATEDIIRRIVGVARECLAQSPPELAFDLLERGIFLSGDGGRLAELDALMAEECEVPVHLTDRPRESVVLGEGLCLGAEGLQGYALAPPKR